MFGLKASKPKRTASGRIPFDHDNESRAEVLADLAEQDDSPPSVPPAPPTPPPPPTVPSELPLGNLVFRIEQRPHDAMTDFVVSLPIRSELFTADQISSTLAGRDEFLSTLSDMRDRPGVDRLRKISDEIAKVDAEITEGKAALDAARESAKAAMTRADFDAEGRHTAEVETLTGKLERLTARRDELRAVYANGRHDLLPPIIALLGGRVALAVSKVDLEIARKEGELLDLVKGAVAELVKLHHKRNGVRNGWGGDHWTEQSQQRKASDLIGLPLPR